MERFFKRGQPAVDANFKSRFGSTRGGQPVCLSRAPSDDIAPWIGRLYVGAADVPNGCRVDCGLFYDATVFRMQLRGTWEAHTLDGLRSSEKSALMFGPQTRMMRLSTIGPFLTVGFSLRPGTGHALLRNQTGDLLDRFITCEEMGLPGEAALARLDQESEPEGWFAVLEQFIRAIVKAKGGEQPDPITARFELAALIDPSFAIADFAEGLGIPQRRLERIITRDFGLTPKQVLRRSRALDMAAQLRGVGDEAEADDLLLRYYDQSHLIREFTDLFGMSPSQFVARPQPLLTMALESRQAGRLEAIARVAPGAKRPWE